MRRTRRLVFLAATLVAAMALPSFASAPTGRTPLGERIRDQFPLIASLAGMGDTTRTAAASSASERDSFLTHQFTDEVRINSARNSVTLRPDLAARSVAAPEANGIAYRNVFGSAEVLRVSAGGANREVIVANTPSELKAVSYAVVASDGLLEIVNDGPAVRFVTAGPGPALSLSAPIAVDSAGRPSKALSWVVDRSTGTPTLRLRVGDHALRYPVAVTYTIGSAAERARPSRGVRANSVSALGVGSISGFIRDSFGTAIEGASVLVYDAGGAFADFASSDSSGAYTVSGLASPANYTMLIIAGGYNTQLYNGIDCSDFTCDVTTGTSIAVADNATTTANVSMTSPSAHIFGRVLGAASVPLDNVVVVAYDNASVPQGSAVTDASGAYEIVTASGGTFYVRTFNTAHPGYLDQLYNGIDCTGCIVTSGTPVIIATGGVATNINFTLSQQSGRIAGTVTDARTTAPVPFARVIIYNSGGTAVSYADADASGAYLSFQGLAPGTYYALASHGGYVPQAYNNKACSPCNITAVGDPITVTAGATTSNINFALNSDVARVSGSVTDATSHTGLAGAIVRFYNATGNEVVGAVTASDGTYSAILPGSGTFYARTSNNQFAGYLDQVYNGHDCSGCDPTITGDPISVTVGTPVVNINFALSQNGGRITGTITDGTNPLAFIGFVQVYSSTGTFVTNGFTDGAGVYTLNDTLATGDYFVVGRAFGYGGVLYQNISCAGVCDVTAGTAVHVTKGSTTSGINFVLSNGVATITGTVRDSSSPTPVALGGATISIYDGAGNLVATTGSDASGVYQAQVALTGTYYALASHVGYADQLWNHIACNGCNVTTTGTGITATVGSTTSGIDFNLIVQCTALTLDPATLPNGTYGGAYSQTISVAGDTVTLSLSSGSLPPGLSFDTTTGILSGTFTAAGSYTFTVTATDTNGCTGSQQYTIVVAKAPTTTALTASPSSVTFGSPVTFTATVSPSAATGSVSFIEGATTLATVALSGGSASFTTSSFNAGAHGVFARYNGDANYLTSDSLIASVNVAKATPVITWNTPAPITYGTPLSSTQLNATANVPGTFVYIPAAGAIVGAGSQTLSVTFTPTDTANYNTASASVTLTVNKATPTVSVVGGTFTYDGNPHPATGSVTGVLGEDLGTPTFTYNGVAAVPVNAGTYAVVASFAGNANYNPASASATVQIDKATPSVSVVGGTFTFDGNPHPATGSVTGVIGENLLPPLTFTYNGGTAAPVAVGTYAVVASFAGNANYLPDTATVTITIITGPAATSSISKNFTGQAIAAGRTIWFNAVFDIISGLGSGTTSIFMTGQSIKFTANGTNYNLLVPDARVILNDPSVTQPTTSFDTTTNVMTTRLPGGLGSGNGFLTGLPFIVPAGGLPGGVKSVTWTATFSTNSSTALHMHWRWAADVFTSFSTSYNALGIKPVDAPTVQYPNNDNAGTPENFKSFGVKGGTGGYSSVANVNPPAI